MVGGLFGGSRVAVDAEHLRALAGKGHRGRLAIAPARPDRAGADHDRRFSLEPLHRLLPFQLLSFAGPHRRDIGADRMPEYLRQRPAMSIAAHMPFAGGAGIPQQHLRHRCTFRLPLKPAVDQPRLRRRLHAGARAFYPRLHQLQPRRRDAPVFLPVDLLDRMRPNQRESHKRERLHDAGRGEAKAQAGAAARRGRCRPLLEHDQSRQRETGVSLKLKSPSRHSAASRATTRSASVILANRKPIATMPNRPMATSALKVASATAP